MPKQRLYFPRMRILAAVLFLSASMLAESAAGVKWDAPPGWKTEAARPMRVVTYLPPPAAGDSAAAECAIYFFGPGQGGSVDANLERWKGQLTAADGKPANAKIAKRTIHQIAVTTIDSSGDYSGMGGPMAATNSVARNYRLLGAIIEAPSGSIFIKFVGPAKTVAARQADFEQMLNSLQKN